MRIPVMTALDADGDGELSAQEAADAVAALKKLDKNGDGKLSREELRPQFGGRGGPGGPGPGGPGRGVGPRSAGFENDPLPKDDAERKILQSVEEILRSQRRMNVPTADGRLLRLLAESLGAKQVVEFGTSTGVSAIWIASALRKTDGKLITHEIDPKIAAQARENFAKAGVADFITVVEGDAHEKAKELKGPIDLVFIDADKEGYRDYLNKTLPLVRPGGLIVAHNMLPRMASPDFVTAITTNPDLETVFYMEGGGVSVTMKKR
jgi:predicted O-methyltransferase YrrM